MLDRRRKSNGAGPAIDPLALQILHRFRVGVAVFLRKSVGGKKVDSEQWYEENVVYCNVIATIGEESNRTQTT